MISRALFLSLLTTLAFCGWTPLRADEAAHERPDPARFAKSIADFDKSDEESPPAKDGIVFTGSSSVRFWKVTEAFPDLPVLNRGFGGSVANDLVVYADKVVLRYHPKVLVVYTGSNDLHAKLTPAETLSDYTKFLQLVHEKLPQTKVIVCSVKVAPVRASEMSQVKALNGLLEAWVEDKPWITWIESTQYLIGEDGQPIDKLFRSTDHLHLNDEGYAKWNAIVSPVLHRVWAEANGSGTK
jgi:lysophospholipase L1-like esterase